MITEKVEILDKLGDFVKFKRKNLGLTQTEVAERMESKGIDKSYISRIERKTAKGLNISTLEKLLESLDSSITFVEH